MLHGDLEGLPYATAGSLIRLGVNGTSASLPRRPLPLP